MHFHMHVHLRMRISKDYTRMWYTYTHVRKVSMRMRVFFGAPNRFSYKILSKPSRLSLWTCAPLTLCAASACLILCGSDYNYNQRKCIELNCDASFLSKPSIILWDRSGFADDNNVMKWEQLDYTRRNLVRPLALQQQTEIPVQPVRIPLRYAPAASKLKNLGAKEGTIVRNNRSMKVFLLHHNSDLCTKLESVVE